MSYCVNCGVELDASARVCPLCNTPVVNPSQLNQFSEETPFPQEKGAIEVVKRKDLGILLTTTVVATAVTCGILNAFVFPGSLWSLAVIGPFVILWVVMIPVVISTKIPIYVTILFDGLATVLYLYMLARMINSFGWFYGLGIPIAALATLAVEIYVFCIRKLPKSILTGALYLFSVIGLFCVGLEHVIDRYLLNGKLLTWSAVVLTICVVIDIAIITMLSRRRLRDAVRRRLHF